MDQGTIIEVDIDMTIMAVNNAINMLLVEGRIDHIGPLYHELNVLEAERETRP